MRLQDFTSATVLRRVEQLGNGVRAECRGTELFADAVDEELPHYASSNCSSALPLIVVLPKAT